MCYGLFYQQKLQRCGLYNVSPKIVAFKVLDKQKKSFLKPEVSVKVVAKLLLFVFGRGWLASFWIFCKG